MRFLDIIVNNAYDIKTRLFAAILNFHFYWHIFNHERNASEFSVGNLKTRREQIFKKTQFHRSEQSTEEIKKWNNEKNVNINDEDDG